MKDACVLSTSNQWRIIEKLVKPLTLACVKCSGKSIFTRKASLGRRHSNVTDGGKSTHSDAIAASGAGGK